MNVYSPETNKMITIDSPDIQGEKEASLRTFHIRSGRYGPSQREKKRRCEQLFPFLDILVENFDPIVLLFPYVF